MVNSETGILKCVVCFVRNWEDNLQLCLLKPPTLTIKVQVQDSKGLSIKFYWNYIDKPGLCTFTSYLQKQTSNGLSCP